MDAGLCLSSNSLSHSLQRAANVREALGDELWEEREGQLNFGIVFVCRFSVQFYSLQAGNYHKIFRFMRHLDKTP